MTANAEPLLRGRGHRSFETMASLAERDRVLREMACVYFPGSSQREAARYMCRTVFRYATGPWRRERIEPECPPRHAGRINWHCWHLLKAHDRVPSIGTIRRVLAFR